ncbi:uncharacterized protein EDB91DRAFT_1079107 [Suillus paluster]|uniref:uncharacterized protein n=1 Tax=Suillus paluster TaxID=48578 RepID=UPI001B86BA61|nr:uncharacterized protein EDB91DRAFT_1079107 [Suillus paluster]KAG1748996.1 hypothetical protein EDB91DRAFT_1079107 [Suillus paluster]
MGKATADDIVMTEVFADAEHDLGEIGGDNGVDEFAMSDTSNEERNNSQKHPLKQSRSAQVEARNATLQIIKTVVCISIILQSSNERCNYLQGLLGIFFHLMSVPQKVIDVLAHMGLSISVISIHNVIHSMSKEIAANIKQGIDNPNALCCLATLWAADSRNPAPSTIAVEINEFDMLKHHINDTYSRPKPGKHLSPRLTAFAWHVQDILVQHG